VGQKYLIDTNIILEFTSGLLPVAAHNFVVGIIDNDGFNVSIINRIEVLGHSSATKNLNEFLDLANTLGISDVVAQQTIELRKVKKIKLPDAIIAATAMVNNFTLLSRNIRDFRNIEGLTVVDPYEYNI